MSKKKVHFQDLERKKCEESSKIENKRSKTGVINKILSYVEANDYEIKDLTNMKMTELRSLLSNLEKNGNLIPGTPKSSRKASRKSSRKPSKKSEVKIGDRRSKEGIRKIIFSYEDSKNYKKSDLEKMGMKELREVLKKIESGEAKKLREKSENREL